MAALSAAIASAAFGYISGFPKSYVVVYFLGTIVTILGRLAVRNYYWPTAPRNAPAIGALPMNPTVDDHTTMAIKVIHTKMAIRLIEAGLESLSADDAPYDSHQLETIQRLARELEKLAVIRKAGPT